MGIQELALYKAQNWIKSSEKLSSQKLLVWEKAYTIPGLESTIWRQDQYGSIINYNQYGNRQSPYGWEIDHITPKSKGGSDLLFNLRPLQWKNNAKRQAA